MAYFVNLSLRTKSSSDYRHIGIIDIGVPPTSDPEAEITVRLPEGRDVRARIDQNHLVPVHAHDREALPVIYATEV
jgi:hypothetical protein